MARLLIQPCHLFYRHGRGPNIDDPINGRGQPATIRRNLTLWMEGIRRLLARPPFAEIPTGLGCGMMWKKERDLLIAETMAFVQSVAVKTSDADFRPEPIVQPTLPDRPFTAERPTEVLPVARISSISQGDLRDEIRRRVAAFRARQQVFDRDRNEYCNAMMAKVRAATEHAVKARDNQPPKR